LVKDVKFINFDANSFAIGATSIDGRCMYVKKKISKKKKIF
jgi:hypothetical protein